MAKVDIGSLSTCIQSLKTTIKYYEFICQSDTVDEEDYAEVIFMYADELARLIEIYKKEEKMGNADIPLKDLLGDEYAVYLEL